MIVVKRGTVDGVAVGGTVDGLTDAQEERLIALGVAERPGDREKPEEPARQAEPTRAELVAEAESLGIDVPRKATKAQIRELIEEDEDGDEPPALTAEVPR